MIYLSSSRVLLLCAVSMVGCSSNDAGDTDASTTATQTAGVTEAQTGSTTATTTDPTTDAPTSTGTPTTGPTSTTGDAGTTASEGSSSEPATNSGTTDTTGTSETTGAVAVTASSTLEPKSGSQAAGTVLFTDAGGGMANLVIELSGVTLAGTNGLHIHEFPDCSAPDGLSTGNHWNPNGTMIGELGTVEIAEDGTGVFMKSDAWSIGTGQFDDVVAHSIIIHAEANGGTRIACGVIAKD